MDPFDCSAGQYFVDLAAVSVVNEASSGGTIDPWFLRPHPELLKQGGASGYARRLSVGIAKENAPRTLPAVPAAVASLSTASHHRAVAERAPVPESAPAARPERDMKAELLRFKQQKQGIPAGVAARRAPVVLAAPKAAPGRKAPLATVQRASAAATGSKRPSKRELSDIERRILAHNAKLGK